VVAVTCTAVVLTGFVMCVSFGNLCTCTYCALCCLYCDFILFRLCIYFLNEMGGTCGAYGGGERGAQGIGGET
jgi:hypothetical protein